MSIFKSNKFFRIIKHFVLALPLMFVLGTSLYAIVNPNAKDSYYGENINESEVVSVDANNLQQGIYYTYTTGFTFSGTQSEYRIVVNDLTINGNPVTANIVMLRTNSGGTTYLFAYNNATYVTDRSMAVVTTWNFQFVEYQLNTTLDDELQKFTTIDYHQYSYLSNAFEYGMYQFTNIGFGQFDFISLFNGIFTTNINNVYASFINDYINYYLFVEIIYFAPWVFHAFVHFAYDLGDYFTSSFKRNRKDDD